MQRYRAMKKRQLPEEMSQGKPKQAKNLKEEVMSTPKKTKFRRKATQDNESSYESTKETAKEINLGTIFYRYNPYFFEMFYHFSNFSRIFHVKGNGRKPSRSEK